MDHDLSTSFSVPEGQAIVMEAISQVERWWATNIVGNAKNVGDVFTVRFGKTFSCIEVVEIIPNKKLVWSVIDCDLPLFRNPKEWLHTTLVWEVTRKNNTTHVRMTHHGLTPDKSCYEDCKKGWAYYTCESLRSLITKGCGTPGTGIFCYALINKRKYEGLLYFKNDPLPQYPPGFIYADVLRTKGEQVIEIRSIGEYDKRHFKPTHLCGEYFMILENKSLYENIEPLQDLTQLESKNPVTKMESIG